VASCDIRVKVTPRSSRNTISLESDQSLKIWVTAAPTDGQANKAVCDLLAKELGIAKSNVSIAKGGTSREKVLRIDGLTSEEVVSKLGGLGI